MKIKIHFVRFLLFLLCRTWDTFPKVIVSVVHYNEVTVCRPWQVELQTWRRWQEGSFPAGWQDAWGTWHWWTRGRDSSPPKPSTCKPTQPPASTCSRALPNRNLQHTHAHTRTQNTCTQTRDYRVMSDKHTEHLETNLVLCCYQNTKRKRKKKKGKQTQTRCVSLCAVKTKKEREIETILTRLLFLSVVFSMKDY